MLKQRVFISYARENAPLAVQLARDLKANTAEVWLDQLEIRAGQNWPAEVSKALTGCSVFLVLLSPSAIRSAVVNNEIVFAHDEGKAMIPILLGLDPRDIPLLLRGLNYLDFSDSEHKYQAYFQDLLSALDVRIAHPCPGQVPIPPITGRDDLHTFLVGTTWRKKNLVEYLEFKDRSTAHWGLKGFSAESAEAKYEVTAARKIKITWSDQFEADCVFSDSCDRFVELHEPSEAVWSLRSVAPDGPVT